MATRILGEEMNVAVFAIMDRLDVAGAKRLHKLVIDEVGMTPVLKPAIWQYPILDGIGGVGETISQPFVFAQPLAESISMSLPGISVTDTWHEHDGFFLILCSCGPIILGRLWKRLLTLGWSVVDGQLAHVKLIRRDDGRGNNQSD